jgi:NAD(P)-dependent dehydrogenase (short-subunit alcohol dehydrogenase family)
MSRVAVVTGAAGGIGSVTCDVLETKGWDIVAVDARPLERPGAVRLDIADAEAVSEALSGLAQVDGLVNIAAIQHYKSLAETTHGDWARVLEVNLGGPFNCLKAVYDQLVSSRGSVVNVGSVHGQATSSSIAAYAASKGGMAAFTRAVAVEMGPLGVRSNIVLPGAIDTPALRQGFARGLSTERSLTDRTPTRSVGRPEDVAKVIAFLIDNEESQFVSGAEFVIDGGALAQLSTE